MQGAALEDREREGCGCEARGSRRRWLSGTRDTRCGPPTLTALLSERTPGSGVCPRFSSWHRTTAAGL